jgi:hypothetical protein
MRFFISTKSISFLGLAVALLLAACGPDGEQTSGDSQPARIGGVPDAGAPTSGVLGAWQYVSGALLFACSDGTNQSSEAGGGTIAFTPGADAARVVRVDDQHCSLGCSIAGDVVTCDPGTCSSQGVVITSNSDVFTIVGGHLQEASTMTFDDGAGTTCNAALLDAVLSPLPPAQ